MGLNSYKFVLKAFHSLAQYACDKIESFQPDLIIPLAHGGWGPWWAVQALWGATRSEPLPPELVLNIGREKVGVYDSIRTSLMRVETSPFVGEFTEAAEVGHFLSWLTTKKGWRESFYSAITGALGREPIRLLFLDDTIWEHSTAMLTCGLTETVFPDTSYLFLSSYLFDWREGLVQPWLDAHRVEFEEDDDLLERISSPRMSGVYKIVPGTEDVSPASFGWRPLTTESPPIEKVKDMLPVETWLTLPDWTRETIQAYVREHAHERVEVKELTRPDAGLPFSFQLEPIFRVYKQLWLKEKLSVEEIGLILNVPPKEVGPMMERYSYKDGLIIYVDGGTIWYRLHPDVQTPKDI